MSARVSSGRGSSNQCYATPPDFMAAVHARFGVPDMDLAASAHNAKAPRYFAQKDDGPGCIGVDSLARPWTDILGRCWLNPPFANIAPWAKRCAEMSRKHGTEILFLVPAAVGSNWFRDHVHRIADVYLLNGRIAFDPEKPKWGYPKDCLLAHYGPQATGAIDTWAWRTPSARAKTSTVDQPEMFGREERRV